MVAPSSTPNPIAPAQPEGPPNPERPKGLINRWREYRLGNIVTVDDFYTKVGSDALVASGIEVDRLPHGVEDQTEVTRPQSPIHWYRQWRLNRHADGLKEALPRHKVLETTTNSRLEFRDKLLADVESKTRKLAEVSALLEGTTIHSNPDYPALREAKSRLEWEIGKAKRSLDRKFSKDASKSHKIVLKLGAHNSHIRGDITRQEMLDRKAVADSKRVPHFTHETQHHGDVRRKASRHERKVRKLATDGFAARRRKRTSDNIRSKLERSQAYTQSLVRARQINDAHRRPIITHPVRKTIYDARAGGSFTTHIKPGKSKEMADISGWM